MVRSSLALNTAVPSVDLSSRKSYSLLYNVKRAASIEIARSALKNHQAYADVVLRYDSTSFYFSRPFRGRSCLPSPPRARARTPNFEVHEEAVDLACSALIACVPRGAFLPSFLPCLRCELCSIFNTVALRICERVFLRETLI